VVQASWWPSVTDGELYQLLGSDPDVDTGRKRVSGPLLAQGKDTGVTLEVRSGGPAIGYAQTAAQMYTDPSITLARVEGFDQVIQLSASQPTIAVFAPLEIDPQIIFWDPETHPEFETIRDIGETDTTVVYAEGRAYMDYLVGAGILKRSQLDGAYDQARFVAERGEVAESGYATHTPYIFEHDIEEWGKPIKYQLVNDLGYPNYGAALVVRPQDKERLAPCLRKLVPIFQQAQVDLMADPDPTIALVTRLSDEFKSSPEATKGSEQAAIEQMRKLAIVSNGDDATLGDFEEARVERLIELTEPIYAKQGKEVAEGLDPSDLMTNDFIDEEIGLED
jgi:hypothetical protein